VPFRLGRDTLGLLTGVLTLTQQTGIAAATALAFYKDPDSHDDPMQWMNTEAGQAIYRAKYCGDSDAFHSLKAKLVSVIQTHSLYAGADVIGSIPGHDATKVSFGEKLAQGVSELTGKPLAIGRAVNESRPASKARASDEVIDLADEFYFGLDVTDQSVILVDDVFRTGETMRAAAAAARTAGATAVLGLVGARTMRR
jgi:predicted amidophosphoribosyltransferase